jgi:hypothetical protein
MAPHGASATPHPPHLSTVYIRTVPLVLPGRRSLLRSKLPSEIAGSRADARRVTALYLAAVL